MKIVCAQGDVKIIAGFLPSSIFASKTIFFEISKDSTAISE